MLELRGSYLSFMRHPESKEEVQEMRMEMVGTDIASSFKAKKSKDGIAACREAHAMPAVSMPRVMARV